MIIDSLCLLSDAQTTTTSVASTNIIDTLAAGSAYSGYWFVFEVTTAFATSTTTPTFLIELQTSSDGFLAAGNDTTLVASAQFTAAQLTLGKRWAVRIPVNCKRYLRGYKTVSTNTGANYVTASGYSMFIAADIDFTSTPSRYLL